MNACEAVQDLLTAHLLSALDKSEEALVCDHLASCEGCREAKLETEACVACLEAPPVAPPPRVWTNIRLKIDREGAADPVRDTDPSPVISLSCSFCRGGMTRAAAVYCASCLAPHHPECFQEHGRCSVMGCAESRIVRPSELPPLRLHEGGDRPAHAPRPGRLRRWFLGGLSLIVLGAGAAALTEERRTDVLLPQWEVHPALDLKTNYRLEVEQATLKEVCEAIGRLPGRPKVSLPPECGDLFIRRASFEGQHWSEALEALVSDFGLRVVEDREGWRVNRSAGFDPDEFRRAQGELLEVDTTRIVDLDPTSEMDARVHQGWEQEVYVAPGARSFAVLEGRKLSLFQGAERKGAAALDAPCSDIAWSPDGSRLAYVVGGRKSGQLGVFDLSSDRFVHTLVRSFPGIDRDSRLAWSEGDERILLKTSTDLKLVSTLIGGQALTLAAPSPDGYRRFDLLPLGADRFLILYPNGVEAWHIGMSRPTPLYTRRVALRPGYQVLPPARNGKTIVLTDAWALLLDTATGNLSKLEEYTGRGDFQASLDPSGATVAYLKQQADSEIEELMVYPLADRAELRKLDPGRGVVRGFRWAAEASLIAFWTDDSVFVAGLNGGRSVPWEVQSSTDARVLDVQWLSLTRPPNTLEEERLPRIVPALAVTTRGLTPRKAEVLVEEQPE